MDCSYNCSTREKTERLQFVTRSRSLPVVKRITCQRKPGRACIQNCTHIKTSYSLLPSLFIRRIIKLLSVVTILLLQNNNFIIPGSLLRSPQDWDVENTIPIVAIIILS